MSWFAVLERAEPAPCRVRIQPREPEARENWEARLEVYRDLGWTYAAQMGDYEAYYCDDPAAAELESDPVAQKWAWDKSLKSAVDALVEDYPDTVFYRKRLERPEIKSLMDQCTCVVCASRDDPMPTFVTEGLIFGKPSIVSEHTGTAGLITEGVDGFVYRDDDPDQLAKVLEHAILHPDQLAAMKADCRR